MASLGVSLVPNSPSTSSRFAEDLLCAGTVTAPASSPRSLVRVPQHAALAD